MFWGLVFFLNNNSIDLQPLKSFSESTTAPPDLAVNADAVVEVTPLVRTESDLQRVGETRDKSILEMKRPKEKKKNR